MLRTNNQLSLFDFSRYLSNFFLTVLADPANFSHSGYYPAIK